MDWFEIIIKVPTTHIEKASAIANMTVDYGIYIEDYSDLEAVAPQIAHVDLIDETLLNMDKTNSFIHIYLNKEDNVTEALFYLENRFTFSNIPYEIEKKTAEDIDWNEYWKSFFHTTLIGNRLAVAPSWEEYENKDNRCVLKINPGAAFGTGTHATTSLCLSLLEKIVSPNHTVLDIGCGSGILAIASVLLGAKSALGVDIDETAVKVANENAVLNGVSKETEFIVGDLADKVSGTYDIITANIVADVIIRLLETIDTYLHNGSRIILSGIIDLRAEDVINAIKKFGFVIESELRKDNWYAFMIKKEEVKN